MTTACVTISALRVENFGGELITESNGDITIQYPAIELQQKVLVEILEEANFTPSDINEALGAIYDIARFSALKKFIR